VLRWPNEAVLAVLGFAVQGSTNRHVLAIMQADLCRARPYKINVISLYLSQSLKCHAQTRDSGGTASLKQRYTEDATVTSFT
jgi:hypothetical protein